MADGARIARANRLLGGHFRWRASISLIWVVLLVSGSGGAASPPETGSALIVFAPDAWLVVRQVPNRVRVGEPFTIEIMFANRRSQDLIGSILPVPEGTAGLVVPGFADVRFDGSSCTPPSVWSGTFSVAGSDPSLRLIDAATTCTFASALVGGTIPAKSSAVLRVTSSAAAPGGFAFSVSGPHEAQRWEIQAVDRHGARVRPVPQHGSGSQSGLPRSVNPSAVSPQYP